MAQTKASLDRELGMYGQASYWIDYYENGQMVVPHGQEAVLIAVLNFPQHVGLRPVPFGAAMVQEAKGFFRRGRPNCVVFAGSHPHMEFGEDTDRGSLAARTLPRTVARLWEQGNRPAELTSATPFSPGRLQGSIRHYGSPITQGPYVGNALEAVVHLATTGRSIAIMSRELDPDDVDPDTVYHYLTLRNHARVGNWFVEFVSGDNQNILSGLNRFDSEREAHAYANDYASTILLMYWMLEAAGRDDLPSGMRITADQAVEEAKGILQRLRGDLSSFQ